MQEALGLTELRLELIRNPPCFSIKLRFYWAGIAQLARASAFQAEGRGFESRFPLQNQKF
jgi:hypothetical protein